MESFAFLIDFFAARWQALGRCVIRDQRRRHERFQSSRRQLDHPQSASSLVMKPKIGRVLTARNK